MNIRLLLSSIPLLSICFCFHVVASAQNTTDDQEPVASPPSPRITTIAQSAQIGVNVAEAFQDRDGNDWFSAESAGLCRYDGKSLTYFREQEGMGGSVNEILQDSEGWPWERR